MLRTDGRTDRHPRSVQAGSKQQRQRRVIGVEVPMMFGAGEKAFFFSSFFWDDLVFFLVACNVLFLCNFCKMACRYYEDKYFC